MFEELSLPRFTAYFIFIHVGEIATPFNQKYFIVASAVRIVNDEDAIDHNEAMVWKCILYYLPFVTDKFSLCHSNISKSVLSLEFDLIWLLINICRIGPMLKRFEILLSMYNHMIKYKFMNFQHVMNDICIKHDLENK